SPKAKAPENRRFRQPCTVWGLSPAARHIDAAMTVAILAIAVAQFTHQQAAQRTRTGADQGAASATGNAADDGPGARADGKILFRSGAARYGQKGNQPKCYFPHPHLLQKKYQTMYERSISNSVASDRQGPGKNIAVRTGVSGGDGAGWPRWPTPPGRAR